MSPHSISLKSRARKFPRRIFLAVLASALLVITTQTAVGQCEPSSTGETAVGLRNLSKYSLALYIDNVKKADVPSASRSNDFLITPTRHVLYAEAIIEGDSVWRTLIMDFPEGYVCTWTVVDLLIRTLNSENKKACAFSAQRMRSSRLAGTATTLSPSFRIEGADVRMTRISPRSVS